MSRTYTFAPGSPQRWTLNCFNKHQQKYHDHDTPAVRSEKEKLFRY